VTEHDSDRTSLVYVDPLDQIWIETARRLGFAVRRSRAVYAHADGRGGLYIGTPETLDPDDHLAQMVFHELCHALVQGPEGLEEPDWGLDNTTDRDAPRERAALRVQRHLARAAGLTTFFAPTTDYRAFWDDLDRAPCPAEEQALMEAGLGRALEPPFDPHLTRALDATRVIIEAATPFWCEVEGRRSLTRLDTSES